MPEVPSTPTGTPWSRFHRLQTPIVWDWPGWLPRGYLTILASQPGVGKSFLCLRIAATYLSDLPWPDGAPFPHSQRGEDPAQDRVLWCESDGGHFLNLHRARLWDLDLSRIVNPLSAFKGDPLTKRSVNNAPLTNFIMRNPGHQEALLALAFQPSVRLVIFDSLYGLMSGSTAAATLSWLMLLSDFARAARKPFLLTHHLRKPNSRDNALLTLDRMRGSSAIAQFARVV